MVITLFSLVYPIFLILQLWQLSLFRSCLHEREWDLGRKEICKNKFSLCKNKSLYGNGFMSHSWDLTSRQGRSHLGGMIFFDVKSFCWVVPPRQERLFALKGCHLQLVWWRDWSFLLAWWPDFNFKKAWRRDLENRRDRENGIFEAWFRDPIIQFRDTWC